MAFSMRIPLSDEIIKKNSFCSMYINGKKNGFEFDVQIPYYRGLFLSGVEVLEVYIDGQQIPQEALTIEVNGKELPIFKLKYAATELWRQNETARIRAIKRGGLEAGTHELELKLFMRIPYMQMGDGHDYMQMDGCDRALVSLAKEDLKLGVSLFCYSKEYGTGEYDFEECVRQAALAGAQGYEIVGSQMLPDYPNVSDDFLDLIRRCREKYGIGPECYGANNDKGLLFDRNLTDDELLASAILDLKTANRLGCKIMRAQYMLTPAAFERLAPYAELFDVKVGIEIHNPDTPSSPHIRQYLDVIQWTGSEYLGFVQDWSYLSVAPNKPKWDRALAQGVKEEHLEMAANLRKEDFSYEAAWDALKKAGANPAIEECLQGMYGYVQFRSRELLPQLLDEMKTVLPYTFEMHAKFHYLDENGIEPSIPYPEILHCLKETDFDGYIMSEYEDEAHVGGTQFTKRQLEMERHVLGI